MDGKKNISKRAVIASGLFAVAIAAFFVILMASQASAYENMMMIQGRVTSVDNFDRTFSVIGAEGVVTLTADKATSMTLCDRNMGFGNIAAGQNVTVTYHDYNGKLVADAVDIAPVVLACYNQ